MSQTPKKRRRDRLECNLDGAKWTTPHAPPPPSSVSAPDSASPPVRTAAAAAAASRFTLVSPLTPAATAATNDDDDEDEEDDDDDDVQVEPAAAPVEAPSKLELERRWLEQESKQLDGPAWQLTSTTRAAKRVALSLTSHLASIIGSEAAPLSAPLDDSSSSTSSTTTTTTSSSSSTSSSVQVIDPTNKRLRVLEPRQDDAATTTTTTVTTTTTTTTTSSTLSTRQRLEQLAARKRLDDQRRKESNYLTNLTEAELPAFSNNFIVDDFGNPVLDSPPPSMQFEDSQSPDAPTPPRRRRPTAAAQSKLSAVQPLVEAPPPTLVDVWTRERVALWSPALRRAWRNRHADPDGFLMRHIDLEARGDGWAPAARGAWTIEERLLLAHRVHDLRDKRIRFANRWGLLSKPLAGRTGAETKLQFEHLFRAGVVRHKEFEVDQSGTVLETIEVEDTYDDRSLKDLRSENCLSDQWDTERGRQLAAQIDEWLLAAPIAGDDEDEDDDEDDEDDNGVEDTTIAQLMSRVHGDRWRWADDDDFGFNPADDVPVAHRMPSVLMDEKRSPRRPLPPPPPQQQSLLASFHGPAHSAATSTSMSHAGRTTTLPPLPARRRLADAATSAAAATSSAPSAAAEANAMIRFDLTLVYVPPDAQLAFAVGAGVADEAQRLYAELTATQIGVVAKTRACTRYLSDALTRLASDDANESACVAAVHAVSVCVSRWPSVLDGDVRLQLVDLLRDLLLALPGAGVGAQIAVSTSPLLRVHCLAHSAAIEWMAPLESAGGGAAAAVGAFSLSVYADWLVRACIECGEARPEHLDLTRVVPGAQPQLLPLLALWLALLRALGKPTAPVSFWPLVLGQLRDLPGAVELPVRERAWRVLFVLLSLDQYDAVGAARALAPQWAFVHDTLVTRALRQSASADGAAFFAARDVVPSEAERAAQQSYVDVLVHRCMQLAPLWPLQDPLGGSSLLRVWAAFATHFALAEPPFVDQRTPFAASAWRSALPPLCDAPLRLVELAPFDFRAHSVAAAVTRPWERVLALWVGVVCLHCPELVAAEEQRRRVIADSFAVPDAGERWAQIRARDGPQCAKLVSRLASEMSRARLAHQHPLALANVAALLCVLAGTLPATDWAPSLLVAGRREPLAALLALDAALPADDAALAVAAKHVAVRACEVLSMHLQAAGSTDGVRYMARLSRRHAAHLLAQLDAAQRRIADLNAERTNLRAVATKQRHAEKQLQQQQQQKRAPGAIKVIGGKSGAPAAPTSETTAAQLAESEARIDAELASVARSVAAVREVLLHVLASAQVLVSRAQAAAPMCELAFLGDTGDDAGAQPLGALLQPDAALQSAGVALLETALPLIDALLEAGDDGALTSLVAAFESGAVIESLVRLINGAVSRIGGTSDAAVADAECALLRRLVRLLMRLRRFATHAFGGGAPLKTVPWFVNTNNWLQHSAYTTASTTQVLTVWPARVALLTAAHELARDAAFVREQQPLFTTVWLRSVVEWPGSGVLDGAEFLELTRAALGVLAPDSPFAALRDVELLEAVDVTRGAPLLAHVLTRCATAPEWRDTTRAALIWRPLASTIDAQLRSSRAAPSAPHVGAHMAACAALVLRCERGAAPKEARAALLAHWTRPASSQVSVTAETPPLLLPPNSAALPGVFYVLEGAPGLAAVLQSAVCCDVAVAQQVLWQRVLLQCSAAQPKDEARGKRLALNDADEALCATVARAVRITPAPAGWPALVAYTTSVAGDKQLLQQTAEAVCQVVANWLASPLDATNPNQWIGFQRIVLALARALVSPIAAARDSTLPRWGVDSFAAYRLTVAVVQLSQRCFTQDMATLQIASRCLYFFGIVIHYAVGQLAECAPTDRLALLPFWRLFVRYACAIGLVYLRDLLQLLAPGFYFVFQRDWYLERDKLANQLADAASAAISASATIGATSKFVIHTLASTVPLVELPQTKHWHAESATLDPFDVLRYVAGMLNEFGALRDEQVANTLAEIATDLQSLVDRLDDPALLVARARVAQAQQLAAKGAIVARGLLDSAPT